MSIEKNCLVCQKTSNEMPVTKFYFQSKEFYICSQHMPVIIHKPQELIGLLDGADTIQGG